MSNENNVTVSKNNWFILCGTVIILLLILLILLLSGNGDRPPTALEKVVKSGKFSTAIFLDGESNIDLFSKIGGKLSPCKDLNKGLDDCGEMEGILIRKDVVVELVKVNPLCRRITLGNGSVYWIHVNGTHAGKRPCHSSNNPTHRF